MNFSSTNSLWDISQAPSQFSQLPEDDFLALLHKQFATTDNTDHTHNRRPSPNSDDSSPSPPSKPDAASRRHSANALLNESDDATLKRKASSDSMEPGPSSKNQHTVDDSNPAKKLLPSRRKSTGNPMQDESRLLKRKEQNRAAQRAFRERKEKHVKDLEDKVAALEAKNEATEAENTNLRDLLSRLQEENLALKQAQFTFSVPKPAPMTVPPPNSTAQSTHFNFFGTPSSFSPTQAPSQAPPNHVEFGSDIDWNSLTTFDPSMLNVLEEPSEVPMQTDTTPSPFGQYALPQSYKTIANNPLLMSFADEPPSNSFNTTPSTNSLEHFTFNNNFTSPPNSWTPIAQSAPFTQSNGNNDFLRAGHSLDELFGANYIGSQGSLDFNALVDGASVSPVAHANGVKPSVASQKSVSSPPSNSTASSPSTSTCQSPFSWSPLSPSGESPPSGSPTPAGSNVPGCVPIVLSRTDMAKHIIAEGPSPFTDLPNPSLRKMSDVSTGDMISCQGSNFPRTKESPENIEVLKAWRCITQSPHFKDADINELCSEFSKKARCDGTKVVLEPESVKQLFEHFKKLHQISAQPVPTDRTSS